MDKKLKVFYRISIWIILILISTNILIKAVIWSSASKTIKKDKYESRIFLRKHIYIEKFTTKGKQGLFNKVDYLLAPAFTLLFVIITVKLIKIPGIFEKRD